MLTEAPSELPVEIQESANELGAAEEGVDEGVVDLNRVTEEFYASLTGGVEF